jgi:kinesin family protein 6/9
VYVKGLTCRQATNEEDALNMLFEGERNRTIAEHSLNKHSSRSHCIFTITVEARSHSKSSSEYTVSRLNLVDLAGSERLSKTRPSGGVEKEAMHMNRSLSFLEQVIVAMNDSGRQHVPFRQSKLTHFLRDSLGGNSHIVLIANVWGEAEQLQETISTLRFATRVRRVQTNPVKNTLKDPQLLLKEYEREIASLKEELSMHNTMLNSRPVSYDTLSELEVEEIRQLVESYLNGTLTDIELVSVKQVKEVFAQFKAIALSRDGGVQSSEGRGTSGKTEPVPHSASRTKRESKVQSGDGPVAETAGETEGVGLGLGIAPASLKHPTSSAVAVRKSKVASKTDTKSKESKLGTKRTESPAPSLAADEEGAPSEIGSQSTRPSTPPPKEEAFEEFKRQRGSEINQVFLDNKATLIRKKKEVIELSATVNTIKKKIDELDKSLSETTEWREGVRSEDGDSGEIVMEEWQFNAHSQLKELKVSYRQHHKNLQSLQEELEYCSQYVSESRRKLVEEFEIWYNTAFVGDPTLHLHDGKEIQAKGDDREFDELQEQLSKEPSAAFYTAQLRTQKRGYQKATRQVTVM